MKLKGLLKGFFIAGLIGLPIYFTNATYFGGGINVPIGQYVQVSDICNTNDNANVSHYITFDKNLNIKYLENDVEYNGFKFHSCGWEGIWGYLYRNNNKLTYGGDFWTNGGDTNLIPDNIGHINNVCRTTKGSVCISTGSNLSMSEFISVRENWESFTIIPQPTDSNAPTYGYLVICFNARDKSYCINYNLATSGSSLGFTQYNPTNIGQAHYNLPITDWSPYFSSSPMRGYDTFYSTTGSCPSVGQLKANSNLTPNVCYAGYGSDVSYGDQVIFQGGTGLSLFETYELTSGGNTLQTWYDTYWGYYQNIARDSWPFEATYKALLGIQFARQTFGRNAGSYQILNYCYYVVNNIPDNTSTCVVPGVAQQYSGTLITDQDKQDIIDSVNDDYNVYVPGSGSHFNNPGNWYGSGGGGGSAGAWGDDEQCTGIPCLFTKFYQMLTSSRVNDVDFSSGGQGILPPYIALAFVVMVLFYVLKR